MAVIYVLGFTDKFSQLPLAGCKKFLFDWMDDRFASARGRQRKNGDKIGHRARAGLGKPEKLVPDNYAIRLIKARWSRRHSRIRRCLPRQPYCHIARKAFVRIPRNENKFRGTPTPIRCSNPNLVLVKKMGLRVMFVVGVVRQQHGDHKGESSGKRVEGSAPQRDRFASSSLRFTPMGYPKL
jgi:hypothetical protein